MRIKKYRTFMCDFETTVFEGQDTTEVWASASVEFYTEDVHIFHSIKEQFDYFCSLKENLIAYYHNLKFDGTFWLSFLITVLNLKQAYEKIGGDDVADVVWLKDKDMPNNSFKYMISDRGQWYSIIIKVNNRYIEIRDSLKLLPFSVKRIGEAFKTKHRKLDMEYKGFRYAGCVITDEEKAYIANDVLVVKEALEIMLNEGHNKTTIGSCCLEEFKKKYEKKDYERLFPNLYEIPVDNTEHDYGALTAGEYIHRSYKGGWCYLVKNKANRHYRHKGCTADVNSLYPSMMHSESGNRYPVGKPHFWYGNYIPDEVLNDEHKYYFIRIKTRFYIKKNKLPFIQIKGSWLYKGTEALETSDVFDKKRNGYVSYYPDADGNIHDTKVVLTLTMTDYILFREHYNTYQFEILDGCYFSSLKGLFDEYINKYKEIKMISVGAMRELAKLFLNNLYGKMASSTDSSFKVAFKKEDGSIGFYPVLENDKKPGYIPIGSAITSYARNFTIRAAQANYHGADEPGFIYADTDSIHCDLDPEEIKGIKVHNTNFCCWKLETRWDEAIFVRQKTYIEHVIEKDITQHESIWTGEEVSPYYNIKCAGMPDKCKLLFTYSMGEPVDEAELKTFTEEDVDFIKVSRTLEDFRIGLKIPGKLRPKRIQGGTVLVDCPYQMR